MNKTTIAAITALCFSFAACKDDNEPDWAKTAHGDVPPETVPTETLTGLQALRLNELNGNDKYIELFNASTTETLDLSGVRLRKDDDKWIWIAPEGISLAPRSYLLLHGNADSYAKGFISGLSADKSVKIQLIAPDGTQLDIFKNPSRSQGEVWGMDDGTYNGKKDAQGVKRNLSFARVPDGGNWYVADPTDGVTNNNADRYVAITW